MIKDNKGTKSKNGLEVETEACRQSIEELSTIFSTVNFPTDTETEEKKIMNEEDVDLDIGISFLQSLSFLFNFINSLGIFLRFPFIRVACS